MLPPVACLGFLIVLGYCVNKAENGQRVQKREVAIRSRGLQGPRSMQSLDGSIKTKTMGMSHLESHPG